MRSLKSGSLARWHIVILLPSAGVVANVVVTHEVFTSRYPRANDFAYPFFAGFILFLLVWFPYARAEAVWLVLLEECLLLKGFCSPMAGGRRKGEVVQSASADSDGTSGGASVTGESACRSAMLLKLPVIRERTDLGRIAARRMQAM